MSAQCSCSEAACNRLRRYPEASVHPPNQAGEIVCRFCWHVLEVRASPRPDIVVLCGSTRFMEAFTEANLRLTLQGKIVLSVGCNTKSDDQLVAEGLTIDKAALDELHKRKIDLADRVLVLNVGGYIGESTRSEIEYAQNLGKPIDWLEATP